MRILHLVSYSLFSGPLPSTLGLALAQSQLGHKVWLCFDTKRGAFNDFEEAAWPHFQNSPLKPPINLVLSAKSTPLEFIRDIFVLRKFFQANQVDIVHVHLSHDHALATLACLGLKKPRIVRTVHADRMLKRPLGWLYRSVGGLIVRCQSHLKLLLAKTSKPMRLVAGGIDAEKFALLGDEKRLQARALWGVPEDSVVIVHVALIADRGQKELLEALESLGSGVQTPYLLYVGKGEGEEALRQCVEKSPAKKFVRFLGYLKGENLREAYAAADAAFLAQAGNDASARAALEAMSSGLPVIAVNVDALADLIQAKVAIGAPSRNPEDIASVLSEFLQHKEKWAEIGRKSRAYVENKRSFSQEAEQTLKFYLDILNTP